MVETETRALLWKEDITSDPAYPLTRELWNLLRLARLGER